MGYAEINELERQLTQAKDRQYTIEANCKHEWLPVISEPEECQLGVYSHLEGHGSDPYPVYNYYSDYKPRWSRTCSKCGKKEYTYEKKATQYEPYFK